MLKQHRLARILKFCMEKVLLLYVLRVLIRLCGCAGWSAPLLFACGKLGFSYTTKRELEAGYVILRLVYVVTPNDSDVPDYVSPRARNRFNQVVEAKKFEGVFLCRKVC